MKGLLPSTPQELIYLQETASPFEGTRNLLRAPREFDPTPILTIEDQGEFSSCVGNSLSSVAEICTHIASGLTAFPQYSRWCAYIWSQIDSNTLGTDEGATQAGGIKTAKTRGFVPETLVPYPARYSTRIPRQAIAAGARTTLEHHSIAASYGPALEWMQQGKGPIWLCIDWTQGLADNNGPITVQDLNTRPLGGHAVYMWGWRSDGASYLFNNWGKSWGFNGARIVPPEVADIWARRGNLCMMSDLKDIKDSRQMCDFGEVL